MPSEPPAPDDKTKPSAAGPPDSGNLNLPDGADGGVLKPLSKPVATDDDAKDAPTEILEKPLTEADKKLPKGSPKPPKHINGSWGRLLSRATLMGKIVGLFLFLIGLGVAGTIYYFQIQKKPAEKTPTKVESLSLEEINKLGEIGTELGTAGQTLNIGANLLIRGKTDIAKDLTIAGKLNANGPSVLSQLNITGPATGTNLNLGSTLAVGGAVTMQRGLTVQDLVAINGGLNVSGSASINSLNANTIAVKTISINGPLTIGHLSTQGPSPNAASGTAVGNGGTVNISGNDTAGTVNINIGSSPPAGVLATIVFRAGYTGNVKVLLSPLTGPSASLPAYVSRTNTGFQIRTDAAPLPGTILSFDYFVTQ